jgi:hypothetical protein
VVSGWSQGGVIAVLAKNYAPSVKAVYALSMSDTDAAGPGADLSSCLDKSFTAIPADKLMVVNGAADPLFGGQTHVESVSGYTCAVGVSQCWSPAGTGAGWYLVQNSQVVDKVAGHCYFMNSATATDCPGSIYDKYWYTGTYNWSMKTNLDWLATLGTKRIFSTSGQ